MYQALYLTERGDLSVNMFILESSADVVVTF